MNKILFQMQCVCTGNSFFVLGTAVPVVVIGICWGNEQNWECQLLLLCSNPDCDGNIDTNNSSKSVSYAEEVLLWMPSGIYCNPCYPCASLLQHCPCHKIGGILLIPHSPQSWEHAVFSTSAFHLHCDVMGQGYGQTYVLSLVPCL